MGLALGGETSSLAFRSASFKLSSSLSDLWKQKEEKKDNLGFQLETKSIIIFLLLLESETLMKRKKKKKKSSAPKIVSKLKRNLQNNKEIVKFCKIVGRTKKQLTCLVQPIPVCFFQKNKQTVK